MAHVHVACPLPHVHLVLNGLVGCPMLPTNNEANVNILLGVELLKLGIHILQHMQRHSSAN